MNFINRKLFITLMCAGLLIMAVGCNNESQQGGCLGVDCDTIKEQEIVLSQPQPLDNFTNGFDGTVKAKQLTIIEDNEREIVLQLVPESSSANEILAQYEGAYKRNYELLISLLTYESEAVDKERARLQELYEQPRTLSNVMVSKMTITGTKSAISAFENAAKE